MVTMPDLAELDTMWCPTCADERGFEVPPCRDGHGAQCPDRACVECGTVLCVGVDSQAPPVPGTRSAA